MLSFPLRCVFIVVMCETTTPIPGLELGNSLYYGQNTQTKKNSFTKLTILAKEPGTSSTRTHSAKHWTADVVN